MFTSKFAINFVSYWKINEKGKDKKSTPCTVEGDHFGSVHWRKWCIKLWENKLGLSWEI
jgi:hypothetical protein